MKYIKLKYLLFLFVGMFLASCSDFLSENSQDLSYINGYDDLDELLMGDVYLPKGTQPGFHVDNTFMPYLSFMCDEVTQEANPSLIANALTNPARDLFGFYTWQKDVAMGIDKSDVYDDTRDWNAMYKSIVSANIVLAGVEDLSPKDDEEVLKAERIKGEALFCRAADFFLLVNLFADAYQPSTAEQTPGIPLKMTEYAEDGGFTRASVKAVYQQIVSDLTEAAKVLKDKESVSVYRINYSGICIFLSRVYLYMQDYENAITWSEEALKSAPSIVDLNTFSSPLFNKANPSILFTMGGNIMAQNISEIPDWEGLPSYTLSYFKVSDELYDSYDDNDLRKTSFFHFTETFPGVAFYDKQAYDGASIQNDEIADCFSIRTAEAWLNLAEAYACSGDNSRAQTAINSLLINRMANGFYVPTTLTGADLVHFVREERRRELCMESHRWFDLRRYQANEAYPETKTLYSIATVISDYALQRFDFYRLEPNDPAWTLPLPEYESNYNNSVGNVRNERAPYETINY